MIKIQSKKRLMNTLIGILLLILGLINTNIALMILSIVLITSGILRDTYFFAITMAYGFLILTGALIIVLINQTVPPLSLELVIYSIGIFMVGILFYIQNIGFNLGKKDKI